MSAGEYVVDEVDHIVDIDQSAQSDIAARTLASVSKSTTFGAACLMVVMNCIHGVIIIRLQKAITKPDADSRGAAEKAAPVVYLLQGLI